MMDEYGLTSLVDQAFDQNLEEEPLPETIWHYTDLHGFNEIIRTGKLWASHLGYMNDAREMKSGRDAIISALSRVSKFKLQNQSQGIVSLNEGVKDIISDCLSLIKLGEEVKPEIYATCFCDHNDLLSQWRAYGANGAGVCIGFDTSRLGFQRTKLVRVVYDPGKQERTASKMVAAVMTIAIVTGIEKRKLLPLVINHLSRIIPNFKDAAFAEEREYRLVFETKDGFIRHANDSDEVKFRVSKGLLIPYVELPFSDNRLPIVSVRAGPSPHLELNIAAIKKRLRAAGYKAIVKGSTIPYRG